MPLQLTPEQEGRIQAVVSAGAYSSAEEALNAAVVAVEAAASPHFDGTANDFEVLLTEGLASQELSEEEFWNSVHHETTTLVAAHKPEPHA